MTKKITILFFIIITAFPLYAQTKIMESFEAGIPKGLASKAGTLEIDSLRIKHGSKALKWNWIPNDALIFNTPIGYHKQKVKTEEADHEHVDYKRERILGKPRGFFMWIYNEKASSQRLTFQFGRDEAVDCEFDFNLNFTGWRTVWIIYDRGDMRGTPHKDMNRMTILAPAIGSGTYYIDALGLSLPLNARNNAPNLQLPNIDPHPRLVTQYAQRLLEHYQFKPSFQLEPFTPKINESLNALNAKVEAFLLPSYLRSDLSKKGIDDIKKDYARYDIKRIGAHIYGRPLVKGSVYLEYFSEMGLGKDIFKGIMGWRRDYGQTLMNIANRYRSISNESQKKELETLFINLFDYGVDQGFDVGAGLGWLHHYAYVIRNQGPAFFLMRDVLKKHGKLDKATEIMRWFYAFGQVYREDMVYGVKDRKSADADDTQGLLLPRFITALMPENSPEKVRDIKHFSSYLSNVTTAYANGLDEVFKPDGTIFHHGGHSLGYGSRGINGALSTLYLLSHTPFKASNEAHARMKKITETFFNCLFTDNLESSKAFASIRFHKFVLPKHFYHLPALIALSADSFDAEMAGLYKQAINLKKETTDFDAYWLKKLEEKGTLQEYQHKKSQILSYSSVGIQRKNNDWMATVRGHSKYVYPYESWGANYLAYPAFIGNGYLDVSYPNNLDSTMPDKGLWQEGYDWRHWPGTTTVKVPYEQILTTPGQHKDEGGEYPFSDQSFVGGVSAEDGNAIFVFPFKGHDMFKLQSFTGKKSYFFFNDMVVCLGSNINSAIKDFPVETTILQNASPKKDKLQVSTGAITTFPYNKTMHKTKPIWLLDNRGTGYYIPNIPKNTTLNISRKNQTNPNYNGDKNVNGDFYTVILNHGVAPKSAKYNYAQVMNADSEKMTRFLSQMQGRKKPYEVLRQDNFAHIVKSNPYKTTSYAIFDEKIQLKNSIIKNVNRPTTCILKEVSNGIKLAVSDPDLNIYDGQDDLMPDGSRKELSLYSHEWYYWPSRASKTQITLKGAWAISKQITDMETATNKTAKIIKQSKKETIIEFECRDGLSAEVLLQKI